MAKAFSLLPLMNLAAHQSDTAAKKLGLLNRRQQSVQQNMDTLQGYRKDYQDRLQQSSTQGISPAELRNFQQFIYKLDEAIIQQRNQIVQSEASTLAGRNEYDAARRKLKSYDILHQRHIDEQQQIAEKAEQKELDEHTSRAVAYKMNNTEK
jgi:flagellar protein FliJ